MTTILVSEGLLSRAQLAEAFGVVEGTIAEWEKQGLPVIRHGRAVRLYDVRAVAEWLRTKQVSAAAG